MAEDKFIDIHCHLDILKNIEEAVQKAEEKDVNIILTCGVNRHTNRKTMDLSKKYPNVKACLGIYPIDALSMTEKEIDKEIEFIKENKEKITAIGEVGMDFKEDSKNHETQRKTFEKFIDLSLQINKPLIIHSRKAELECIELLEQKKAKKVLMHCFCGKRTLVERIIKNNWFLSIPASIKNSIQFQENAKITPLQQLFCETDSPFLHPDKNQENEPSNVIISYEQIAKQKILPLNEVIKQISKNYKDLFVE